MKYIRVNDGIEKLDDDWSMFCEKYACNKQSDTIEELIQEGDLVKYVDTTRSYPYVGTYCEITDIFNPCGTAIYRVIELYIEQSNGDYKLVAKDKGNYKLELV